MAYERLKDTALSQGIADVVSDFARLFQAEVRLAKAEVSSNIREKLQSAAWFGAAGALALVALIFFGQGIAAFLVLRGWEAHWANLAVAVVVILLTAICAVIGLSKARQEITPERTVQQVRQDIHLIKEQLS